jgi:hypothetical protein
VSSSITPPPDTVQGAQPNPEPVWTIDSGGDTAVSAHRTPWCEIHQRASGRIAVNAAIAGRIGICDGAGRRVRHRPRITEPRVAT